MTYIRTDRTPCPFARFARIGTRGFCSFWLAVLLIPLGLGLPPSALAASYTFSIASNSGQADFDLQGQAFTPVVQGSDPGPPPAWAKNGEVSLVRFEFTFPAGQSPPASLYIYDHLASLAELQHGFSSALVVGSHLTNGVYLFPEVRLQYRQRYYALFPTNLILRAGSPGNWGGGMVYKIGSVLHEGAYGTPFKATFQSDPYFTPSPPAPPPLSLGLDSYYTKYLDAGGIPVLSGRLVPDITLYVVRETVLRMLAKRRDLVAAMVRSRSRVGIMAWSEVTTNIPEHADLYTAFPGTDWNTRARGLGATLERPLTSCAEENVMHYGFDRYFGEDILIHEFSHGIDLTGARVNDPAWDSRLSQVYQNAITKGRWANTYAASNQNEYFAEGVQSFFDVNAEADPPNGIHNFVNTRAELKAYDPELYGLIREVFSVDLTPLEAAATLAITRDREIILLRWDTQPGVVYDLQLSRGGSNPWQYVGNTVVGSTNRSLSLITDSLPTTAAAAIYRLTVQ